MRKFILFPILLFFFYNLKAQEPAIKDTIEYARSKAYQKDFAEADRLLTIFTSDQSNVNAMRLHAQVLYWMKDFNRSSEVYETALTSFPDVQVIKLDYGRMLFETGKLSHSLQLLEDYRSHDSANAEVNILLAQLYYWKGHIQSAKERLQDVLKPYPDNPTALNILKEINNATAPYIRMRGIYTSDDQPLQSTGADFEAGWYKSWLLNPKFQINYNHFTLPDSLYNSLWIQLGNKIFFGNSGFSVNATGGIFKHHTNDNTSRLTGNLILSQKLSNSFSLEASIAERPYQYSSTSVRIQVMQTYSGGALNFNKGNKWLGRAAYEMQKFEDNTKIQTIYFWFLTPIVNKNNFTIKGGYAFSYSNADINTFTSIKSLSAVIQTTAVGGSVGGYYNPYFTPNNQTIHSLLVSVGIALSNKINFTTRINVGVLASADNPDLILNRGQSNNYSINKVYNKQSYTPIDFQNELLINLSNQLMLGGVYGYTKLLFYTVNQGAIQLKYVFINEKKKQN